MYIQIYMYRFICTHVHMSFPLYSSFILSLYLLITAPLPSIAHTMLNICNHKFALVQSTSGRMYHVIPDDHYPTSDNTYTLQHYLNNTSKYFTSNAQLHFLPGQYFLNTDLIISNISNFSLVGNISNEEIHTIINCTSPAGVLMISSEDVFISNVVMWNVDIT